MASQIFFDICEKKPIDVDLFFSDQIYFPKIEYEPRVTAHFPIPREVKGMQIIQDSIFSNLEKSQNTIFTLFFASVCHLAGHAKVTDFKKYKEWMKGKNEHRAYETIEFIEDIRVDDFLKNKFPEYYSEIIKVKEFFDIINDKNELIGIISEGDCMKQISHSRYYNHPMEDIKVGDHMVTDVETIDGEMNVFDAADKFLNSKRRRFPIVKEGKLVGLISQKDVLKAAITLK